MTWGRTENWEQNMPEVDCVSCGYLGWGFTAINPESALWGVCNREVTAHQRSDFRRHKGEVNYITGADYDQRAYLGCYRDEWLHLMYEIDKAGERKIREEILRKRQCPCYTAYASGLNPEEQMKKAGK